MDIQRVTDEPSNIRWHNIPYSTCKRFFRKSISLLFAIIVIAASFGIVIASKYVQREIDKDFNSNIECTYYNDRPESEVYEEYIDPDITSRSKVKTYCFCQSLFYSQGFSVTQTWNLDNQGVYPCKTWIDLWIKNQSFNTGVIILVPTVNVLLSFVLSSKIFIIFI